LFSGEIPDIRRAWASDAPAVAIGTVTGITAAAILVAPRLTIIFLPIIILLWIWARWGDGALRAALPKFDGLAISVCALLGFALLSSLWSDYPGAAIDKIVMIGAIAFASLATVGLVWGESRQGVVCASEGLWLGFLIGLTYYFAEAITNQGVRIWLVNALHVSPEFLQPQKSFTWVGGQLVEINDAAFTRAATPITLILWPAIMAAQGAIMTPWNTRVALIILAVAIPTTFFSPQETSKLAIIIGLIVFGLTWCTRRWAARLLAAGWVVSCLAVVPAVMLAHRLDLHNAAWLQSSAQHRIIIWSYTAEHIMKRPLFGIGAYMTYLTGLQRSADAVQEPNGSELQRKSLSRHSHNFFLQTWLELGAVGAVLLMLAGLQVIRRLSELAHGIQPYAFATFASAAILMSASYGIWQAWLLALFGLTPILFAVGARALETSRPTVFGSTS
jgi:O-antigen ligase